MKSFSAFITEKRTKGGRTGNMKFPGDDAYRKMQDELSKKEKTKSKTVKQSEVSQQAKDYRTAQGEKKYQAAKTDVEVRRGFQTGKGGLKADESNPYVKREVRQQRAIKQGVPDPFKSKTPAPSDPFKGLRTGSKPQVPDPFKGATTVPPKPQKPKVDNTPGPAETEARRNIRDSQARIDATKPGTKLNLRDYVKSQTKGGGYVSPELKDAIAGGRTRGSEIRVGGDTAPSRKPRTSGKPASAAVSSARASGDFRVANPPAKPKKPVSVKSSVMGPETKKSAITRDLASAKPETRKLYRASPRTSSFKEFSRQATAVQKKLKSNNPSASPAGRSAGVQKSSAIARQFGNPMRQGAYDKYMSTVVPAKVKVDEPKGLPSGKKSLPGTAPIKPVDVKVEPPKTQKPPAFPGTAKPPKAPKPSSIKLPPARKTPALAAAAKSKPLTQAGLNKTLRGIGGRALGLAGAGYDAVSSYQEYKKRGDSDKRAGVKSAFRTGLGYAGGALGGLLGGLAGGGVASAVTGTAGAIGGYSAGTSLADWVLGQTRYERKKKAREKAAAKAAANK